MLAEALAQKQFRFAEHRRVGHEAHDVVVELRERGAHLVELVLRLDEDLVEAVGERPDFLLFGERAEVPLSAPVAARTADPLVEHAPAVELHHVVELRDQIGELRVVFVRPQLVRDLERHRNHRPGIVGQRRLGHQDLVVAVVEPVDHFRGGLLPREIEKELLDVLDFERSLLEPVLLQEVFHGRNDHYNRLWALGFGR